MASVGDQETLAKATSKPASSVVVRSVSPEEQLENGEPTQPPSIISVIATPLQNSIYYATPPLSFLSFQETDVVPIDPSVFYLQPPEQNVAESEREQVLMQVYQISRFLRVVCMIDIFFVVVFGLVYFFFFFLAIFPALGHYGAKRFYYWPVYIYSVYVLIEIFGGIVAAYFIKQTVFLVLRILFIIFNIIIYRYSTKLASFISVLGPTDFEFLRSSQRIVQIEKTLFC